MIIPKQQDDYLAEGYFRAGHTLRQTRYIFIEGEVFTTIWSRVPLHTARLSKTQRKLQRRIERSSTITVGPYRPSADQDELYERYVAHHPLDVPETIAEVLGEDLPAIPFQTFCLRIERDGVLVGMSCFDIGDRTAASLFGCYDPAYAAESLGFATLLLEMDYCRHLGEIDYYYPGYCVVGLGPFAYKMRLPDLEGRTFLDETWGDMQDVLARPLPHQLIERRLVELQLSLEQSNIDSHLVVMPLAEHYYTSFSSTGPLPHVQMLALATAVPLGELFVGYDALAETYEMWLAAPETDLRYEPVAQRFLGDFPPDADLRLFSWRIPVLAARDPSAMLRYLQPGKVLARMVNL